MRNFVWGAVIGATVMYWYLHANVLRGTVADLWSELSAPPATAHRTAP